MNVVVCQSPVLRVATGMNDPIHVQVEVVKFHTIWIREASINRQSFAVHHILLQKVQKRRIIMSNVPRWMHVVCVRLLPASAYVSPRQQAGKHEDIACIPPLQHHPLVAMKAVHTSCCWWGGKFPVKSSVSE